MAIVLKYTVTQSENAKKLLFKETTGAYQLINNETGWGSPNEELAAVTSTTLTVTPPGGTAIAFTSAELGGLTSFPTDNTQQELEINSSDLNLGSDTELPDGLWTFKYDIVAASSYSVTKTFYLYKKVECCVLEQLANLSIEDCSCSNSKEKTLALEAYTYFVSLEGIAKCNDNTQFTKVLDLVYSLCNLEEC